MEHPIHSLMKISLENIKEMIDVDTIVGDPIHTQQGTTIIPISRVKLGFASGGTDQKGGQMATPPFGGGSGGTVSITPIAFLVVTADDHIRVLSLENETHLYEKLIDFVPELINKIKLMANTQRNKGTTQVQKD